VVTALLAAAWLFAGPWCGGWASPRGWMVLLFRGGLYIDTRPGVLCDIGPDGWTLVPLDQGLSPRIWSLRPFSLPAPSPTPAYLFIPLWIPGAAVLALTFVAWRRDDLARGREGRHLCPKCHYDRTGLAASAKCPECGAAPAAR
jgi:hypothetical protein